ncbi:hypothetical protein CLOM_g5234 [Closterium sp. NIES-68]|nr:hypothetical protein CLOM_g5234 [Closterium sp. NIES-68]GJP83839.1 hypothetical protein CLOP_g13941 [Closterium sp. NIES-67]
MAIGSNFTGGLRNASRFAGIFGSTAKRNSSFSNPFFLLTSGLRLAGPILMLVYPLLEFVRTIEFAEPSAVRQWLTYWVLFSIVSTLEHFLAPILSWIPLYSLAKLAGFAWLVLPKYHGAALIYDTLVHPFHVKALGRAHARKLEGKREREEAGAGVGRAVSDRVTAEGPGGGMQAWEPEERRVVESLNAPTRQALVEFVNDNGLPAFVALLLEGNKQARKGRSPALGDDLETRLRGKADLPTEGRTSSGSKPVPEMVSGLSKRRVYNPSSEDTTVEGGSATTEEQRANASSKDRSADLGAVSGA